MIRAGVSLVFCRVVLPGRQQKNQLQPVMKNNTSIEAPMLVCVCVYVLQV